MAALYILILLIVLWFAFPEDRPKIKKIKRKRRFIIELG